jgi:TolB-like protein
MIGRTLSHYRILEKLGAGGMGEVYCAEDIELKRKVAFKVLPPELADNAERLGRFRREAEILAALDHPNIVTIYSVEEADGVQFLTMGLVEGRTLDELIPPGGLTLERFLEIAGPLADAVAAAHDKGITHRDLKPKNIMVTDEGRVKVLDFGVAKLHPRAAGAEETELPTLTMTREGVVVGTVPYMAPEQLQGQRADTRSDVFSLGIVLYQMATGKTPFQGQTSAELFSAILRDLPSPVAEVRPELPRHLGRIVHQCLEKDPQRRFQSGVDLRNQVATLSEEVQAEKLSRFYLPPPGEWLPRTRRGRLVAVVASVAVLVALALGIIYWARAKTPGPIETPQIASLAVLPLENLSGDPEQDYFADGITEALITDLAMIGGLEKVIARPSVMVYKGTDKPLPQIAEELGVEALVTGSVLRDGNRVQVTAQLLEAPTEEFLWSDRFQRDMKDILSLQNEIVGEIVTRVEVQLTPREATALARRDAVDPEAFDATLRGEYLLSIYEPDKAVGAFREALAQDAIHVPAYLGLAEAHRHQGLLADLPPREAHRLARAAVDKALELEPENARVHKMSAMLAIQFGWDSERAEADFRRARELEPETLTGDHDYAWYLVVTGRFDEGIAVAEEAIARDPLNPDAYQALPWSYFTAGRHEEALVALDKLALMAPTGFADLQRAWNLAALGRGAEAVAILEPILGMDLSGDQFALMTIIWVYYEAGETAVTRELFDRLQEIGQTRWLDPVYQAIGHACVGEYEAALGQLERGLQERSVNMIFVKLRPSPPLLDVLDPLFTDPRFQEVLRQMDAGPSAG